MDEVAEIKNRLDIAEVIGSYLTLKKAGANYKAKCPFHNEKTPSFMVSPERQTFKCFGCGEGGDIFTFIEKIEGIDFYNALKILATKANVKLESHSVNYRNQEHKADQTTRLIEINDWAKKLYHKILLDHPKAASARAYIEGRGITKKTIEEFEIGYAPNSWDFLIRFLKSKKYTESDMAKAGLVVQKDDGGFYDRFRGRIIFPINNIMGNTVAFTSRILVDDQKSAKYINSADSPIYHKGKTIYALDKAKLAIKQEGIAVFVEGNMDVIACHQAGFKNVVATSGTAITEDQLKILSRYADEVAFAFDQDEAGTGAMKKAVEIALKNDINAKIIKIPDGFKDPDEAIQSDPKNWQKAAESPIPALEHWIDLLIRKTPALSVTDKKKIAKEILPILKIIYSEIEKEHYIKYLSKKLSISESSLIDTLEKTKNDQTSKNESQTTTKPLSLNDFERIAAAIWSYPSLSEMLSGKKIEPNSEYKIVEEVINKSAQSFWNPDNVKDEQKTTLNELLLVLQKDYEEFSLENLKIEMLFWIKRVESGQKEAIKSKYAKEISEAEKLKDKQKVAKLLSELSQLLK